MKRYLYIMTAALCLSCSESGEGMQSLNVGEGRVEIVSSAERFISDVVTKSDDELFEIPESLLPTTEELAQFELHIMGTYYAEDDTTTLLTFDETYESIEAYNTAGTDKSDTSILTPPYLPAGDYTATITDNRDRDTEGEGAEYGCFSGEMSFTIVAQKTNAEQNVVAALDNSLVRLQVTEMFESYFTESSLSVVSESGTSFNIDFPLDTETEERFAFMAADTKLYLSGSATKQDPGTGTAPVVTFTKTYIGSTSAGGLTTVVVDAASAGTFTIQVIIDDTITTVYEQSIDLNDIE